MNSKGQSLLEYVLLIGIVTMALIYMGTDFKRALQSVVKVTADQMGSQEQAEQDTDMLVASGFLLNSVSNMTHDSSRTKSYSAGVETITDTQSTHMLTRSISNAAFTSNEAN